MARHLTSILPAAVLFAATCAAAVPQFTLNGVERNLHPVTRLIGGDVVEIAGQNLGPANRCDGAPNYPTLLCGVQVLIGDKPAGMVNVSANRLYFIVPKDAPAEGAVDMRVVYNGTSSPSVTMPAGRAKTIISLDEPAYTDMAVWLRVAMPASLGQVMWPDKRNPAGFGCYLVEVRRNGQLLPVRSGTRWVTFGGGSGPACGPKMPAQLLARGRLPLHLLYNFDQPGRYEVRFTFANEPVFMTASVSDTVAARISKTQSDWTPIDVLPSPPGQRARWLEDLRRRAPADAMEVLSDVLPNVLGHPDNASLAIVLGYLYHPDDSVRRYAGYGLDYWPDDLVARKLLALLGAKGPTDAVIEALFQNPEIRKTRGSEILNTSLPFLVSESPVLLKGAVAALTSLEPQPPYDPRTSQAVVESAPHVLQVADKGDVMRVSFLLENMMAHDPELRTNIIRSVREKFARLSNADDAAIAAYLHDRAMAR
jgi:hypothetical protein